MKPPRSLIYYITAHGYGHGVRSCDIINALLRQEPGLDITVVTDLPVSFLSSRLSLPPDAYRAGSFDVGMVQLDSIRVDVPETLARASAIVAKREALIVQEAAFLRERNAGCVVCDIPSFPIEAAKQAGIPAIAVGNFAWDWIYEEFIDQDARWRGIVDVFREGYAQSDLLLKLPFSEPMSAFPRHEPTPLVSIPGTPRRRELAARHGLPEDAVWVMLSFTTLDLAADAIERIGSVPGHAFITMLPLEWKRPNFHAVDRHAFKFADVMASADVIVSKPGYGILSECVVNEKPLVYAERTDFREYPILEDAVKRHMRNVHIPAAELYAGNLQPYLEQVEAAPPPAEPLVADGGKKATETILSFLD